MVAVARRTWLPVMLLSLFAGCSAAEAAPARVDKARREVRITATVQPDAMECWFGGVKGHHAIVWKRGRAQRCALFASEVSDHDVRVALDAAGARAGENLTMDSWNARADPNNSEPDKRVEGTAIDVFVEWKGSNGPRPLASLIAEKGRTTAALDFRYGGNERYQKDFKSGCIVCLYSCPGGAIGNREHPIRDYIRDGVVYSSRRQALPAAGTPVTIIFKVRMEGS